MNHAILTCRALSVLALCATSLPVVASDEGGGREGLTVSGTVEVQPKMLRLGQLRVTACGETVDAGEDLSFRLVAAHAPCGVTAWVQLPDGRVAFGPSSYVGLGPPNGPKGPEVTALVVQGPSKRDITTLQEATAQLGRTIATVEAACAAGHHGCAVEVFDTWRGDHAWMTAMLAAAASSAASDAAPSR